MTGASGSRARSHRGLLRGRAGFARRSPTYGVASSTTSDTRSYHRHIAVAPDIRPGQTPAERDAAVLAFRDSELRSRLWETESGRQALCRFWTGPVGRWFRRRFEDATPDELHGYAFWGPIALAVLVTELLGTGWFVSFDRWPTISTTIGHLQDLNSLWGVPVVGLVALAAFYALTYEPKPASERPPELSVRVGSVRVRYGWPLVYGATVLATVTARALGADRYEVGYVLYGSLAILGIVVPLLLVRFRSRRAVFPTLFLTFRYLRLRFDWLAGLVLAGLAILVIHLALYPWPNLAREPATFAGLTGEAARRTAARALRSDPGVRSGLVYSTRSRTVSDGQDAWFVYFTEPGAGNRRYAGCFVVVTKTQATPSRDCLVSP